MNSTRTNEGSMPRLSLRSGFEMRKAMRVPRCFASLHVTEWMATWSLPAGPNPFFMFG
jgi:hypothetical protein